MRPTAPAPSPRRPAKAVNWEGIVAAIFCAVLIGRMFVVKEQVADLHHRLDPLTEDLFSYHGNQTIRQEAFFIDLEAKALRFEARYRRAPPMCGCAHVVLHAAVLLPCAVRSGVPRVCAACVRWRARS